MTGKNRSRQRLKCDGTRAETRFRLSAKRTSPFKPAGASVQSTTGSRGVRISCSNGGNSGYTVFAGSVKGTGYPLHSPVSPSLPPPRASPWAITLQLESTRRQTCPRDNLTTASTTRTGRVKRKGHPRTGHEGPKGE